MSFKWILRLFLLACTLNAGSLSAQTTAADSSLSEDGSYLPAGPAIVRSVLLPGWGQLYQERLGQAALFYGTSATYYYRAFFHLYHYNKGKAKKHLNRFHSDISVALFLHGLNIIEAADVALRKKPKGWQGALLSDKPIKSPWGATLRSAIFPGWGQLYNESYVKAAAYLAVDGYLFYKIRQADIGYRHTRNTAYRDDRSRYSWYLGLAYLITLADSYAGAYLYKFDEAVKMTFSPQIINDQPGLGIYVRF